MEREAYTRTCPYNDHHIIHRDRFVKHILKCAKNYPPKYKETCPFNATHIMFRSELEEHVNLCPDRKGFTPELYTYSKIHGSLKQNESSEWSEYEEVLTSVDPWDGGDFEDRMKDFTDTSSIASSCDERRGVRSKTVANSMRPLRPPRGYGLPVMMEFGNDNGPDDVQSVVSTLPPVGRGIRPPSATPMTSTEFCGRGGGRGHI
ncbi:gametocyte-specific factor 1 [Fopius arisanus]|uniref:Gametocyte-specific factor 1 n=1 Tax=Fopius arisanus TaxID=64838 RepID=A0A9R1TCA5_9HYME|nr:PREDICTED: gametocyte-specific factor 1 [Fopius arisanus]XP_011306438.1 PREDICTED: gametocyte-specific factor 1 [Fopius arisanus]